MDWNKKKKLKKILNYININSPRTYLAREKQKYYKRKTDSKLEKKIRVYYYDWNNYKLDNMFVMLSSKSTKS